jgi:hypothetical protein
MARPADEVILRFIAQQSSPDERKGMVKHLLTCRECRELTAMIARFWKLSAERVE